MADYRLDCCGGFPSHSKECAARGAERLKAKAAQDALLDKLYAKYGELIAQQERSTVEHNRLVFGCNADGFLAAIRIVEGKDDG